MKVYSGGSPPYLDSPIPTPFPSSGGLPPKAPTEQKPLIEDTPQGGDTLLDNSQKGLSEPLGELPVLYVRVLKDGIIFELPYDVAIERDDVQILHGYERVGYPLYLDISLQLTNPLG